MTDQARRTQRRRVTRQNEILEHVVARLGSEASLTLEIRSTNSDGYDEATKRVVSENAKNLGAQSTEFE